MNFFAHGRDFVDEPYVLAGTAVPDWLNVVDRRAKARASLAAPFVDHADPQVAGIARGIVSRIVSRLKGDGIDWIGLVAERGTHQLYENLGFQQISDSKALLLKDELDGLQKA